MTLHEILVKLMKVVPFFLLPLLFLFKFLFIYNGYPDYGNFFTPLSSNQLDWSSLFFNRFQYNTVINTTPESTLINIIVFNVPLSILTHIFSMDISARLYSYFIIVFFMSSAYLFSLQFKKLYIVGLIGAVFLTFNSFMISIISSGDYIAIISETFLLLSLVCLKSDINDNKFFTWKWLFSLIFLTLTIDTYQAFVLGTLLYTIFMIYFKIIKDTVSLRNIMLVLARTFVSILVLFLLILPDVFPLYAGGYTKEFISNPGLGSFVGYSVSPLSLLFLQGYPPDLAFVSVSSLGVLISRVWETAIALVLLLILVSPLLTRNFKMIVISILIIFFSFLGSDADSFLYPLSSFLYIHFPGYESLNASFYWDWFIISPLYLTLLLSLLKQHFKSRSGKELKEKRVLEIGKKDKKRAAFSILIILLLVLLVLPILTQGYYNDSGINDVWGKTLPSSYTNVESELSVLANNSSGGVAYFNPDINLFFNNSSNWFVNPLITFPSLRTAGLTYYGSPNLPSNNFFYSVYKLFYQNQTKYIGQLMALAGIEFFVVLNGTNSYTYSQGYMPFSEGKNANILMKYQNNIKTIFVGKGYVIYKNLDYSGTANNISNFTLVSGGLNELAALSYYGFNLTSMGIVNVEDLNPSNYNLIINKTNSIVIGGTNEEYGIVLASLGNPLEGANFVHQNSPENGWVSTQNFPPPAYFGFSSINPVAVADGHALLKVPIGITNAGNYSIWVQVRYSDNKTYSGGLLNISIGSRSIELNTSSIYEGLTNSFVWVRISTYLFSNAQLNITSITGWNDVGSIFVLNSG